MRWRRRFLALAAVLVVINVGGLLWIHHELTGRGLPKMRVLSWLPVHDIDAAERLSLVFDEPIVAAGLVSQPLDRSPFRIEPHADGHWVWTTTDRLDYVLDRRLPPGRSFTIRPAPDFESQTGRALIGRSEFRFETRPLEVLACELGACDRDNMRVRLKFNQPVGVADLVKHLSLHDPAGGGRLDPQPLTGEPGAELTVQCARPASDNVRVRVDASLAGFGAERSLGDDYLTTLSLPKAFVLLRAAAEAPGLDTRPAVRLVFSRTLDHEAPVPDVTVTPPVQGLVVRPSDDALVLDGPFEAGRRYTATVAPGIVSKDKERLAEPQRTTFDVPDYEPEVRIPLWRGVLSSAGRQQLDVRAVNIERLRLTAYRVLPQNLVAHVRDEGPDATSRALGSRDVPLRAPRNQVTTAALDLRDWLGGSPGIYRVEVAATDRAWVSDWAVVTISDLGITTKRDRDGFLVWVTSIRTAQPAAGVEVTAMTYNNQLLATATTGDDGTARLAIPSSHPDGDAWMIAARHGDDTSYVLPRHQGWDLDDADVAGSPYPETYDVLLYADRGVYRPGDTIHLAGLIRDAMGRVPPSFPLAVRIRRPDGREVAAPTVTPAADRQGFFQVDYTTPADGQFGRYRMAVTLPGADEVLGEHRVLVEEFVPVRLDVRVSPTRDRFVGGQPAEVHVAARYLFGRAAAGLSVTTEARLRRLSPRFAVWPGYRFDDPAEGQTATLASLTTTLDDDGEATIGLPVATVASAGLSRAEVSATVTEAGGRSVSNTTTFDVDGGDRHVGLALTPDRIVAVGEPARVDWIQVDGRGDPVVAGPIAYRLERVEFETTLQEINDRYVWATVERATSVAECRIEPDATGTPTGTFDLTCRQSGLHRLTVTDIVSGNMTRIEFDAAGDAAEADMAAARRPGRVDVALDRSSYEPGSTAQVLVRAPFAGTMLCSLETDRVLWHRLVDMTAAEATVEAPIPADLRGDAFLVVTVVRPVDANAPQWRPHRAIGLTRVHPDRQSHALSLALDTPPQARPGEALPIVVRTQAPAADERPPVVHVWAVDEGILLTTNARVPDPAAHFFAARRAAVESADVFADLLPDYERPAAIDRIGADAEDAADESLLRNPVASPRREAAVVWHDVLPVGPDGTVHVDLPLPDLCGAMRVMAVAADADQYASAESVVRVTAPLIVEMSGPRCVASGDRFAVPVKVFNTTDAPLDVTIAPQTSGPIASDKPEASVVVAPGSPHALVLTCTAGGIGSAAVRIDARALLPDGSPVARAASVPIVVRPAAALHSETRILQTTAGQMLSLSPPDVFRLPHTRLTLTIGGTPDVQLRPALEQLIDYPYGCVEQTTSRLFALLHVPTLLEQEGDGTARVTAVSRMIDAGIARLWSMQTRSGGLGYWPGDREPNRWGTMYAATFLVQARRAGYVIDPQFTRPVVGYLGHVLDDRSDPSVDDAMRAMACRVLAAFGEPPQTWLSRLYEEADKLDIESRAHLMAAWLECGRKDRAAALLAQDVLAQHVATTTAGRITSQVRQEAVLLDVLLDFDPHHPWVAPLVQRLEAARTDGYWGTTLETATALAALARYQSMRVEPSEFQGQVVFGDGRSEPFDHKRPVTMTVDAGAGPVAIRSDGRGDVHVVATYRGLLADDATREYDRQLVVGRRWLDRDGEPLDVAKLRVGDLVMTEIEVSAPALSAQEALANVAIVDALPGGLEVENPRLATSVPWSGDTTDAADRVEFRDDRVIVFASVSAKPHVFRYALRAVTAGDFALPPVQASCMYDPSFASIHGAGHVRVMP